MPSTHVYEPSTCSRESVPGFSCVCCLLTSRSKGTSRFFGMVAPFATTSAATVQYARGLFTSS